MFKALQSIPLFKDVENETLLMLEPLFEPFSCPAGTAVFEQGDRADYLYLILEGSVEVVYKPYDGPPIKVTNLTAGSIFGWSAVIGNTSYTSSTICKQDCQAIRLSSQDLRKFCLEEPEAGRIILSLLADSVSGRWENAQNQIQSLLSTSFNAHVSSERERK